MFKVTREQDEVFATLTKNGMLIEYIRELRPSEKFMCTMTTMLIYVRKQMEGRDESEGVFKVIDNEDGILDGLLATTVIHFYKHHLGVKTLDFKTLDNIVTAMKLFYPGQVYINYINNVVYNKEVLLGEKLRGTIVIVDRASLKKSNKLEIVQ